MFRVTNGTLYAIAVPAINASPKVIFRICPCKTALEIDPDPMT